MMCPLEMKWSLPRRLPLFATTFASFARWRRTSTSITLPCTTLDHCQSFATQPIQVFAKCVCRMRRRHSSSATSALHDQHGTMDVAAHTAIHRNLGRSSSIKTSTHGCYGSNRSAVTVAPGVKLTAGQAVVTAPVARMAAAKGGLMEQYGHRGWSRGSPTARRTQEIDLLEGVHDGPNRALLLG